MANRSGLCLKCGAPSNPNGIGGALERCVECVRLNGVARRLRWSEKNKEKERQMKAVWAAANKEKKHAASEAWRKANMARVNEAGRAWKKANPSAMRAHQLRKYGLTPGAYAAKLESQGGCCAICGSPTPQRKTATVFCVDHDHDSGRVRGLLCVKCNAGLGSFRDDTRRLLAAVDYLIKHGAPGLLVAAP